ncbi:MAG: hypothetical protein IPI93_06840 [Sphingobacteriaceae bacterium]|nr:hypothetical protein [Sphingobacteriaceae bacterium]
MPIIRTLLSSGNTVILGTTSLTEKIFKEEFPELKHLQLPEYDISYSSILPLWLKLGTQYTKVLKAIKSEHEIVEEYIAVHNINVVISDNRYGLYSKNAHSIIVCHQLSLKTPFFQKWSNSTHVELLKKFNEVWVPDYEEKDAKLAGELSENVFGLNCKYIGPLSRLEKREAEIRYDYLFLLSGPEPTQTDLLKSVIDKLKSYKGKAVIISSSSFKIDLPANIILIKLPNANELSQLIAESKTIVCRSGYSTLMDIYLLEKKELILIPTPGQTEQEYLAEYWSKKFKSVHLAESQLGNHSF